MTSLDRTFETSYDLEVPHDLPPTSGTCLYYPGATSRGGSDGVLIRVIPESLDASAWLGVFGFGQLSPKGLTGLFSFPDPNKLCVVAKGAGYIVDTRDPTDYCVVSAEPVFHVAPSREAGLLIFGDYLRLVAYDARGLVWRTARLSWDGIKVNRVTKDSLYGTGWSAPLNRHVEFVVDLKTGQHKGGPSPPP